MVQNKIWKIYSLQKIIFLKGEKNRRATHKY